MATVETDFDWDAEVQADEESAYQSLVRGIERSQGFCLQFVQCTPIKAKEIIERLETDLVGCKTARLVIDADMNDFYQQVSERYQAEQFDVLFVQGLEDPMLAYEQRQGKDISELSRQKGYGGRGWENVPLILGNINLSREKLRDDFPLTLVFFLPEFALNYFIRRAPDFFDWRSNTFSFKTDEEQLKTEYQRLAFEESDFDKYRRFSPTERVVKIKEIISYLNEVLTDEEQANLWFEKGAIHGAGKEYKEALASYDEALEIKPDFHKAWNSRGIILCDNLDKYKEAIVSFEEALKIKSDYHQACHNRGVALFNLGRYEEAIASYDKALEIKPDHYYSWHNRGVALRQLGRYEEAITSYDKALEIKPDKHEAWFNRGNALDDLGRKEEAIASYDKALEIKPDKHEAWNARGAILYDNLGKYEEAIISFEKALETQPDFHSAWFNRGVALSNLGRKEEAIASYDKALEIKPDDHQAWYNRGNALNDLGRKEEAIASYGQALEIKPDKHEAWNARGAILCDNLGKYEEAIISFEKALETQPDFHSAWFNRGVALSNLGRKEEAILSHEKAFDIRNQLGDREGMIQSAQALMGIHQSLGNMRQVLSWSQQMTDLMQEDENWIEKFPAPKWMKGLLTFSQKGFVQSILGISAIVIVALIMLPFNLCVFLWRKIRNVKK